VFIILLNFIPTIGVHYLLRPIWFDDAEYHTNLTSFEFSVTVLFLPLYLILANYFISKKFHQEKLFLINSVFIIICIFISTELHFLNWADSIGRIPPDRDTLEVMAFERTLGVITSGIGLLIIFIRLFKRGIFRTS